MRLFFALWPREEVRAALAPIRTDITRIAGGRPTLPHTLHMTLVFAGNVPEMRLSEMLAVGDAIRVAPFDFPINVAGCFASAGAAWVGAETPPTALMTLQRKLQQGVIDANFDVDARNFWPHVTVVRHIDHEFEMHYVDELSWHVDEFSLVRGMNLGGEVRYEPIKAWPLRAK